MHDLLKQFDRWSFCVQRIGEILGRTVSCRPPKFDDACRFIGWENAVGGGIGVEISPGVVIREIDHELGMSINLVTQDDAPLFLLKWLGGETYILSAFVTDPFLTVLHSRRLLDHPERIPPVYMNPVKGLLYWMKEATRAEDR